MEYHSIQSSVNGVPDNGIKFSHLFISQMFAMKIFRGISNNYCDVFGLFFQPFDYCLASRRVLHFLCLLTEFAFVAIIISRFQSKTKENLDNRKYKKSTSKDRKKSFGTANNEQCRKIIRGGEMSIYKELEKRGFVFDREYGCNENRAEIWINKEAEMGVRIEWFRLD